MRTYPEQDFTCRGKQSVNPVKRLQSCRPISLVRPECPRLARRAIRRLRTPSRRAARGLRARRPTARRPTGPPTALVAAGALAPRQLHFGHTWLARVLRLMTDRLPTQRLWYRTVVAARRCRFASWFVSLTDRKDFGQICPRRDAKPPPSNLLLGQTALQLQKLPERRRCCSKMATPLLRTMHTVCTRRTHSAS